MRSPAQPTPSTTIPTAGRRRRATDITAERLGRATLAYLVVMMGIITLAPFQFAATPQHGLTDLWTWSDLVMNVLMFLPFGFVYQMTRPAGSPAPLWRVLALGAALSAGVEIAQLFEPTRYTSLFDIATNAAGAAVGSVVYLLAVGRVQGENAVRTLALELPLMALVYLLVPLAWLMGLASGGEARQWLALPVGVFAGGILGTVHAAYVTPGQAISRRWLLAAAVVWFCVALLPATLRDRRPGDRVRRGHGRQRLAAEHRHSAVSHPVREPSLRASDAAADHAIVRRVHNFVVFMAL